MLSQNKECQERLRKQLQQVLPSPDTPISTEHLEKLPYINACIKETLRCVIQYELSNILIYKNITRL